jgi:hypothetical protein
MLLPLSFIMGDSLFDVCCVSLSAIRGGVEQISLNSLVAAAGRRKAPHLNPVEDQFSAGCLWSAKTLRLNVIDYTNL